MIPRERKYSLQRLQSVSDFMAQFGFDYAIINQDGRFVVRMTAEFLFFDVTVSYILVEDNLLIWID